MQNDARTRCGFQAAAPKRWRKLALVPALAALAFSVSAQTNSATKVKDFSVPEYYPPPHETQLKTLLQGAEAEPGADGRIFITDVKIRKFAENGRLEMLVEAPHCVFDTLQRAVNSSGPLRVRYADGNLHLEGEGFLWQQTNGNLIISNRVRTIIRANPEKSTKP